MADEEHEFGFRRQGPGGRAASAACDVYISRVRESNDRESLSIRISATTMKRLGWVLGDFIIVDKAKDGTWIITRVSDTGIGLKLSAASTSSGNAYVRFTTSQEILDRIFTVTNSITGSLYEFKGNRAVFVAD